MLKSYQFVAKGTAVVVKAIVEPIHKSDFYNYPPLKARYVACESATSMQRPHIRNDVACVDCMSTRATGWVIIDMGRHMQSDGVAGETEVT